MGAVAVGRKRSVQDIGGNRGSSQTDGSPTKKGTQENIEPRPAGALQSQEANLGVVPNRLHAAQWMTLISPFLGGPTTRSGLDGAL